METKTESTIDTIDKMYLDCRENVFFQEFYNKENHNNYHLLKFFLGNMSKIDNDITGGILETWYHKMFLVGNQTKNKIYQAIKYETFLDGFGGSSLMFYKEICKIILSTERIYDIVESNQKQ